MSTLSQNNNNRAYHTLSAEERTRVSVYVVEGAENFLYKHGMEYCNVLSFEEMLQDGIPKSKYFRKSSFRMRQ